MAGASATSAGEMVQPMGTWIEEEGQYIKERGIRATVQPSNANRPGHAASCCTYESKEMCLSEGRYEKQIP